MPTNRKFYVDSLRFLGEPAEDFIKTVKVLAMPDAVFNTNVLSTHCDVLNSAATLGSTKWRRGKAKSFLK